MYDQEKKKSRGFGFLSFEDEESVERCVSEHFVNLNGKQVEIKKAEPRDVSGKMNDGANTWGAPPGAQMGMGGVSNFLTRFHSQNHDFQFDAHVSD